ncbi:single-stranded DNA-binding protein, partial [Clostridium sp.]|uniref:single-stranded DNA-binding protein n=1 Tax=Clostridium sp. TaxID=1506 RepID=UPI0032175A10
QAESTANYMSKGKLLSVAGRIETRSYEAKDGGRRYVTEVVADEVSFLEWGGNKTSGMNTSANSHNDSSIPSDYFGGGDMTPIDDGEDMPF